MVNHNIFVCLRRCCDNHSTYFCTHSDDVMSTGLKHKCMCAAHTPRVLLLLLETSGMRRFCSAKKYNIRYIVIFFFLNFHEKNVCRSRAYNNNRIEIYRDKCGVLASGRKTYIYGSRARLLGERDFEFRGTEADDKHKKAHHHNHRRRPREVGGAEYDTVVLL